MQLVDWAVLLGTTLSLDCFAYARNDDPKVLSLEPIRF
jgi:hypothetical protein